VNPFMRVDGDKRKADGVFADHRTSTTLTTLVITSFRPTASTAYGFDPDSFLVELASPPLGLGSSWTKTADPCSGDRLRSWEISVPRAGRRKYYVW